MTCRVYRFSMFKIRQKNNNFFPIKTVFGVDIFLKLCYCDIDFFNVEYVCSPYNRCDKCRKYVRARARVHAF